MKKDEPVVRKDVLVSKSTPALSDGVMDPLLPSTSGSAGAVPRDKTPPRPTLERSASSPPRLTLPRMSRVTRVSTSHRSPAAHMCWARPSMLSPHFSSPYARLYSEVVRAPVSQAHLLLLVVTAPPPGVAPADRHPAHVAQDVAADPDGAPPCPRDSAARTAPGESGGGRESCLNSPSHDHLSALHPGLAVRRVAPEAPLGDRPHRILGCRRKGRVESRSELNPRPVFVAAVVSKSRRWTR